VRSWLQSETELNYELLRSFHALHLADPGFASFRYLNTGLGSKEVVDTWTSPASPLGRLSQATLLISLLRRTY
jgi:hypothetical protein